MGRAVRGTASCPGSATCTWRRCGRPSFLARSEDLPNTLASLAHASLVLAPQNWADGGENTGNLANAVIYRRSDDTSAEGVPVPDTNGANTPSCFALGADDELLGAYTG